MSKKIDKSNKKNVKLLEKVGFRKPFQIILDDRFIDYMNKYCKRYKHLKEIFRSEPKLYTTQCIMSNYKLKDHKYTEDISNDCEIIQRGHKNPKETLKCLKKIYRKFNKNHYILSTSTKEIIERFKERKDVPILNFYKGIIRLYLKIDDINKYDGYVTEATEAELERLKKIFANEEIAEKPKIESINIEELEVSRETSGEDGSDYESEED